MDIHDIRAKLAKDEPTIGTWLQLPSADVAELMARAGYDWVAVDMEHGSFGRTGLPDIFRAIQCGGAAPFARLPIASKTAIKAALEAGAQGLIFPMIESREQLDQAISWATYPGHDDGRRDGEPLRENRGVGFCRANAFGRDFDAYMRDTAPRIFLVAQIEHIRGEAKRLLAVRRDELAASGKSEKLRLYGELLSANLYMAQKGMSSITVPNWYDEGKEVTIPLDLRFSPSQNAQNFFKNYKKKQTAARMLVDLLAEGEKEIAYLETVLYEVETAAGEAALNEIRAELKGQGYLKYYKQRDKRQKPADFLRFTSSDGFEILVGRNNAQNDKLTLHTARGKDLWFHVQKAPGSHVVVMSRGEDIPDTTRQEAAELAVIYSSAYKAGTGAKVAVDTTEVKNIWKANGAKPGMVLYEVYTTVYITPRDGLEEQLKQKK